MARCRIPKTAWFGDGNVLDFGGRTEAARPHLLKVTSEGAPIFLVRGPDSQFGTTIDAGVCVHCPPARSDDRERPAGRLPGDTDDRSRWLWSCYIDLIVDRAIVDLNRIRLPTDTPIIDERFDAEDRAH